MKTHCMAMLLAMAGAVTTFAEAPVTLSSLLLEMGDPDALARWPQPAFQQLQASSYNRASTVRGGPGWFADSDGLGFVRTEERDGRTEWVMMEHSGPGCITRIWTPFFYYSFEERTGPHVRIYLDGAAQPVIDCPLIELVRARQFVDEPFSAHTARAGDLYLPIPFAAGCRVTMLRKPFYNIINYRAYPKDTPVETFTMEAFEAAVKDREAVGRTLLNPPAAGKDRLVTAHETIAAGDAMTLPTPKGSAVIHYLEVLLTPGLKNDAGHLRSTVLTARFDREEAVWCPVGDFFGSADGVHPFKTFAREVTEEGAMICRWAMPYEKSAELKLLNLGTDPVDAQVRIAIDPWVWDERSMHFRANWRPDDVVPGTPFSDWNFIEMRGQGVLVGDQWTVLNPNGSWWGEGDEKIYVDQDFERDFPSHFGTGTEDYYGWAGGRVPTRDDEFSHPYLSNIRVGGLDGWTRGFNICTRHRGLDAIPFRARLRFDMEASFGVDIRNPWNLLGYSAATWWYARPGAKSNLPPSPGAAARPILSLAEMERQAAEIRGARARRVEGAIEIEDLKPTGQSKGLGGHRQIPHARFHPDRFSGGAHYFVPGRRVGDFVEFTIPEQYKPRRLILHLVRSHDFGIVQVSVNGQKTGEPIDLYEADPATILPVDVGEVAPEGNTLIVRVELVGKNPDAGGAGTLFGLDCLELKEPLKEDRLEGSSFGEATSPTAPLTRIAFGSCNRQDRPSPIWKSIVAWEPDLLLMLGDNIYGDSEDMDVLRSKYAMLAAQPGFDHLREHTPIRAIWDDHDFGRNDAGREYPMKAESQQVFLDFFGVPADSPRWSRPGIYFSERFGPAGRQVQVIGLDARYFRDSLDRLPEHERGRNGPYAATEDTSRTMLGETQWTWLEQRLREPADLRIIMSGVQFVSSDHHWEGWGTMPHERTRMMRLLKETGANGVLFVSGDRHRGEISRDDEHPDRPYPIVDITASAFNQAGGGGAGEPNRHRIGQPTLNSNFGTLGIDWSAPQPSVRAALRDVEGKEVEVLTIPLGDLSP